MNERYYKWLKKNFFNSLRLIEYFLIASFAALFYLELTQYAFVIISLYVFLSYKSSIKRQKKPLVYTKRCRRLFAMNTFLMLLPLFASLIIYDFQITIESSFILSATAVSSFAIIGLANIFLIPVELSINRWYYNDAERILRSMPNLIIIGITGSYGKTSTKHFLHTILSEKYNVLMTPGSYNTTMGVIRTVREYLKPTHQVFIVEMGAKHIGDIKKIADLVRPYHGIITAVGEQHLDTMKTIENVQKTKFELVDSLPEKGVAILNADYEYVIRRTVDNCKTRYYSNDKGDIEYRIGDVSYNRKGTNFSVYQHDEKIGKFETPMLGEYNLSNILASIMMAKVLNVDLESISVGIKRLRPVKHRMEVKQNKNGITIIDDAFNSNPMGAKMALDVLKNIEGDRKIIVTPGMVELGDKQIIYNENFGKQIATSCDYVILVGNYASKHIKDGMMSEGFDEQKVHVAKTFFEATKHLNSFIKSGDVVLYENDLTDDYENQ
jgi:UDP-N-acetylmuramoyl-tripeptide--D-alanyl-D-alanine ligase